MANDKKEKRKYTRVKIFVVSESKPAALFYQADLASSAAGEGMGLSVHEMAITTVKDRRRQIREAAMANLSDEQKRLLGLVKKPARKKKAAQPNPDSVAA